MAARLSVTAPSRQMRFLGHMALATTAHSPANTPSPRVRTIAAAPPRPLSWVDLIWTNVEVRNGTPMRNLAHEMRSRLSLEGFCVPIIGNYVDFGMERTKIYYCPGSERVAESLRTQFFPDADLEQKDNLHNQMDVKVILGHELMAPPQMVATLAQATR
jgi:hypothetical protein